MTSTPRGASLFWTFAGVFLVVLAAATALQMVLSTAVLRPLALQGERARARAALSRAANALETLPEPAGSRDVMDVMNVFLVPPYERREKRNIHIVKNVPDVQKVPVNTSLEAVSLKPLLCLRFKD